MQFRMMLTVPLPCDGGQVWFSMNPNLRRFSAVLQFPVKILFDITHACPLVESNPGNIFVEWGPLLVVNFRQYLFLF